MSTAQAHSRGILGNVRRLDLWLHVVLLASIATCTIRYLSRHRLDGAGLVVLVAALAITAWYALRAPLARWGWLWVSVLVALWAVLTWLAPSFAWTAVPIAFAVLQVVPFRAASLTALAMTVLASAASLRITEGFDPTLIAGPLGIVLVTLVGYRWLQQEAVARQRLLDQLRDAQDDLALAQRRAGALAERNRISRELHDCVGQQLSSITLHLAAAEAQWDDNGQQSRGYVASATGAARDALVEVRAVVRDLATPEREMEKLGDELLADLRRVLAQAAPGLTARLLVHGDVGALPLVISTALVRTVQGALANSNEHARAKNVIVTLTFEPTEVHLDICDDGIGFVAAQPVSAHGRGHGLTGIRQRATELGGSCAVESSPGDGTTVSVRLPRSLESS